MGNTRIEFEEKFRAALSRSPAEKRARDFISKVAEVSSPVLLLGPTGSGKEVMARAIHDHSPKADKSFVAISCASLTEHLLESELFGHEKGAFTGASATKPGKFELANGGTILLDEVGELSLGLQAKLLRVLQEKKFFRVGGLREIASDARVVAATHRPLREMVKGGQFREDLFFRLNVLAYELPSLDERRTDVGVFLEYFWDKLNYELGRDLKLSPEAKSRLLRYSYPGNIRELQNVLERIVVLSGKIGEVGVDLLPKEFEGVSLAKNPPGQLEIAGLGSMNFTESVEIFEASLISKALIGARYNQIKTAASLGISRSTLQYKMKKYAKRLNLVDPV